MLKNGLKRLLSQRNLEHEVRTWPTQGYMALELLNLYGEEFFVKKAAVFDSAGCVPRHSNELEWFPKKAK